MLNREGWLTELALKVEPYFAKFHLAKYRVSCGWPCRGGVSAKRQVVGECHGSKQSKDGTFEVFVSPVLDKPLEVAGTLCHELAHVAAGIDAKHGKWFIKICNVVGLTAGKPRSIMPGKALNEKLDKLISALGPYPHASLGFIVKPAAASTITKLVCAECEFSCTTSLKKLDISGLPTCGCGALMEVESRKE